MVLLESGVLSITNNVFSMTSVLHSIHGFDRVYSRNMGFGSGSSISSNNNKSNAALNRIR